MSNIELPRVTDIIKPFSNFRHVQEKVLLRASERGTAVHSLCASIAQGEWVIDSLIHEELKGYVDSFRQWHAKIPKKYIIIEQRFRSEKMGYTGQVDFVIESADGNPFLVDIKTSASHQKTYPIQMAAYTKLLHEAEIDAGTVESCNRLILPHARRQRSAERERAVSLVILKRDGEVDIVAGEWVTSWQVAGSVDAALERPQVCGFPLRGGSPRWRFSAHLFRLVERSEPLVDVGWQRTVRRRHRDP